MTEFPSGASTIESARTGAEPLRGNSLTAGKFGYVYFRSDRREANHGHALCFQRSDESKRVAEHHLIGSFPDFHFVKHAVRSRIEDTHGALVGVDDEAVSPSRRKPKQTRSGFCFDARQQLALGVDYCHGSIGFTDCVDGLTEFR